MKNYAVDIAVKMFTSSSSIDLEEQMNTWMNDKPNALVIGMDVTSAYDSVNSRIKYTVILAYQTSEQDAL